MGDAAKVGGGVTLISSVFVSTCGPPTPTSPLSSMLTVSVAVPTNGGVRGSLLYSIMYGMVLDPVPSFHAPLFD